MDGSSPLRRFPVGAEVLSEGGVSFRVWAGEHARVAVVPEGGPGAKEGSVYFDLEREAGGYFSGRVPEAAEGTLYRFRLDGDRLSTPTPPPGASPKAPTAPRR